VEESRTTGQGRGLAAGWQSLISFLATGALFALSFPPFDLPEAAYVFAVPLLLYGLFGRPAKREGLQLLAAGWLSWLVLIVWLRNCTLALDMPLAGAFGWFITLALALILAAFWSAWCLAALKAARLARTQPVISRLFMMLGMAGLWVVLEWLRGWLFTGFPWLPLSTSQWQRPLLLQIASLTGGYGISFVLVCFNFGLSFYIFTLWHNRKASWLKRLSPEFYLALAVLLASISFGLQTGGTTQRGRIEGPRLAFIQPDIDIDQKWDSERVGQTLDILEDLSTYAEYLGADLVLWPESPTPLPVKGSPSMQRWVENLSRKLQLPILMGNVAREELEDSDGHQWYNAVFVVGPDSGVDLDSYYAKRHLVPFGEYVPLAGWLPFIRKFVPIEGDFGHGLSPRVLDLSGVVENGGQVGNLICYEDIFPSLARANVRSGADWHYVATNNAWFGEEGGAWQHAAHSVLRAVETRRPVVRCGNAGWSGWIDEFGHIRHNLLDKQGSIYFQGVDTARFTRNAWWAGRLSPYVRYGDWFVWTSAGLVMVAALLVRWYSRRHRAAAATGP